MESQRMTRLEDDPDEDTATQTFEDTAIDPAVSWEEDKEAFEEGSPVNVDEPE